MFFFIFYVDERVFESKKEALTFMKSTPGSRFKMFTSREAAAQYSRGQIDLATPKANKQVTSCSLLASASMTVLNFLLMVMQTQKQRMGVRPENWSSILCV